MQDAERTDSFFLKRAMFPCPVAAAILPRPFPLKAEKRPWYDFLLFWKDAPPVPDPFDLHYILLTDENADDRINDMTVFLSDDGKKTPQPVQPSQADDRTKDETESLSDGGIFFSDNSFFSLRVMLPNR